MLVLSSGRQISHVLVCMWNLDIITRHKKGALRGENVKREGNGKNDQCTLFICMKIA
jgi:hypothetical protein